ncbi:hypothetical protein Lalb_Chr23g0275141 [Lupinus albus]|uniref:Uncharacterized protein n=1 Tax=Lupinus albus TaxID=3870 RepID=A0A6A4NCK4_LUPAL|nr:hypothetical protein Lalb_Chr23g0275141 [Lupinus albus]
MGTKQPRFARHKGKGHGVLTNIAAVMVRLPEWVYFQNTMNICIWMSVNLGLNFVRVYKQDWVFGGWEDE